MNFEEYVKNLKRKINVDTNKILFVCIGTSKVLWDSVGPQVGSYLKKRINKEKVIGDMYHNICSKWDLIYYYPKIRNRFIVAIDTALCIKKLEGRIFISNTPTIMGLALNKNKGIIGDISIKIALSDLKNIDEQYVMKVAEFIGRGICEINM